MKPQIGEGKVPDVPGELQCSDADFENMMQFAAVLLYHAMTVHAMLPGEEDLTLPANDEKADELLDTLPKQFTRAEALAEGKKKGLKPRTMEERLQQWVTKKNIIRISKGHYCKVEN